MVAQEPSDVKQDQRDFALWKGQKPHEDFAWDSPWGPGRPGWHIECTAMAEKWLGPVFELHGGDLTVENRTPSGALFSGWLPLEASEASQEVAAQRVS